MACVPELGGGRRRLEAIPGLPPVVDELPRGLRLRPRCHRATEACRAGEITLDPWRATARVRCIHPVETPKTEAAQ
jgi:peptide/nickel transport system permease protein